MGSAVYLEDAEIEHILKGKRFTDKHREKFAEIFALAIKDPDYVALQTNGRRRYYRQIRGADWWRYAVLVDDLPSGKHRVVTAFRIVRVSRLSDQFGVQKMLYERPEKYTPPFLL